ncbi:inorganic phosphate transporter [Roseinatronobacter bogoriensis]|uniref:Phosphate transporter n=1 Tax=Roseinatronobacter bogoriensis subsp. barguzinensis TaxID=441209 RepID=A0A2K8KKH0_9RHOB|nr:MULTISPECIES: inorganic phosphate transporter [Rhodobaca]ATX67568.1 inorganic phosphate transporter [Rhodobaca barguzinensis]MBB4209097.1 PiT family inorganic phosphate transporter [Rhodobaca bogoriensis DSM 18756]TDW36375.1 PiT family inorganic phosphate transporter [Rhodobaca barguzinensis]TDY67497.1 PiT family inorganic phosphate transporter [Rhodobaca bogoriensis DSM 18756]
MSNFEEKSWKTLNKDLDRISAMEQAVAYTSRPLVAPGLALAFMAITGLAVAAFIGFEPLGLVVIAAAIIGAYMAINIGANDVANNMGPAVGARALTIGTALIVAALCETAGALIAGGDVVGTVSRGIIAPESVAETQVFIWAMMAALLAGALWINLATWVGAPVSTTHSIVGGVMGAGIAAAGFAAVNWPMMGRIAASWVISPVLGGIFAAFFLAIIKSRIIYRPNMIEAARYWVPILIGIMGGCFATYLSLKGLDKLIKIPFGTAVLIGLGVGVVLTFAMRPVIRRQSEGMENRKKSLKILFNIPLIFSAALLSFAHGANDVANAIGPVAAIVHAVQAGDASDAVGIPLWVMLIGGIGLSIGLLLFGPKLINIVGSEITRLNAMRAYCVALAAAITVIFASWLGLPVSSTHIAIGAIFGVGFFREWYHERILKEKRVDTTSPVEVRKRKKVVRRAHFVTILAAWVVTVPTAALLSAMLFYIMNLIAL